MMHIKEKKLKSNQTAVFMVITNDKYLIQVKSEIKIEGVSYPVSEYLVKKGEKLCTETNNVSGSNFIKHENFIKTSYETLELFNSLFEIEKEGKGLSANLERDGFEVRSDRYF